MVAYLLALPDRAHESGLEVCLIFRLNVYGQCWRKLEDNYSREKAQNFNGECFIIVAE